MPRAALEARLSGLPDGVSVEPGRIEVRFRGATDARRAWPAVAWWKLDWWGRRESNPCAHPKLKPSERSCC